MSVEACSHTIDTGKKCSTGSEQIKWLCRGFEFRVAAVCWHKIGCRADAVGARLSAPVVPSPPSPLAKNDQLKALDFLFTQCAVLYVPYCQQQVIDGQLARLPSWKLPNIAIPSLEKNWFSGEKVSIMSMPDIQTREQSRDLSVWLGTVNAENTESDDGSGSPATKETPSA